MSDDGSTNTSDFSMLTPELSELMANVPENLRSDPAVIAAFQSNPRIAGIAFNVNGIDNIGNAIQSPYLYQANYGQTQGNPFAAYQIEADAWRRIAAFDSMNISGGLPGGPGSIGQMLEWGAANSFLGQDLINMGQRANAQFAAQTEQVNFLMAQQNYFIAQTQYYLEQGRTPPPIPIGFPNSPSGMGNSGINPMMPYTNPLSIV